GEEQGDDSPCGQPLGARPGHGFGDDDIGSEGQVRPVSLDGAERKDGDRPGAVQSPDVGPGQLAQGPNRHQIPSFIWSSTLPNDSTSPIISWGRAWPREWAPGRHC